MEKSINKIYNYLTKDISNINKSEIMSYLQSEDLTELIDYYNKNSLDELRLHVRSLVYKKTDYRIKINFIGKLRNIDIQLKDFTTLTGRNNVGKSTVLKCIFILFKAYKEALPILERGEQGNTSMSFSEQTYINNYIDDFISLLDASEITRRVAELKVQYNTRKIVNGTLNLFSGSIFSMELLIGDESLILIEKEKVSVGKIVNSIEDVTYISSSHILNYIHTISSNVDAREVGISSPGVITFYDNDMLGKLIPKTVFNAFGYLSREKDEPKKSCLFYKDRFEILDNGIYYLPNEVGNGIKLNIMLSALNYNHHLDEGNILLIDEPEDSLHTYVLKDMVSILSRLKCNVVTTTHSADYIHMLSTYTDNFYILEEKFEGQVTVNKVNYNQASDYLTKEIVGDLTIYGM